MLILWNHWIWRIVWRSSGEWCNIVFIFIVSIFEVLSLTAISIKYANIITVQVRNISQLSRWSQAMSSLLIITVLFMAEMSSKGIAFMP